MAATGEEGLELIRQVESCSVRIGRRGVQVCLVWYFEVCERNRMGQSQDCVSEWRMQGEGQALRSS